MSTNATTSNDKALFAKMALDGWHAYNKRVSDLIDGLTDEQLQNETAPGRNTGVYLVGHLTAVSDSIRTLIGTGERLYPQLEQPFLKSPDKSGQQFPPVSELRSQWTTVKEQLEKDFNTLQPEDWFTRHTVVSEEDFAKEPHRNKLNIIIGRTQHLNYHFGQLAYLKERKTA